MKINQSTIKEKVNRLLHEKHAPLYHEAAKYGKHLGLQNLPSPNEKNILPFTGSIKAGYEELGAHILQEILPSAQFPQAKISVDHFDEKIEEISDDIRKKEGSIIQNRYELGSYSPGSMPVRIFLVTIFSLLIILGETYFNAEAFQLFGDNLRSALFIALAVSFAVGFFSHLAAFEYKKAISAWHRRKVILLTFGIAIPVFIGLALLRSQVLQIDDVEINPTYFVMINLLLFIVSCGVSLIALPTWAELKENAHHLSLYVSSKKKNREIKKLKKKKDAYKDTKHHNTQQHIEMSHMPEYVADRVTKLYAMSYEKFKSANVTFRSDGKIPLCFYEEAPTADIHFANHNIT